MESINCSIGIFAHNEADNIQKLLNAVISQELHCVHISEVIVVSSGSTDGTDDLVRDFTLKYPQVRLITQAKREGKSSAINLFLAEAKQPILVIISADVIPAKRTIEQLVSAFTDANVGASGGRPVPVNSQHGFMGYAVHLLWRLHHRMALISPKLGEMIAFRKIMEAIPKDSAVDEASIEAMLKANGYTLKYIPEALIHNKGPETLTDFIKQRRRIQNGHLWLADKQHYTVVSQNEATLLKVILAELRDNPFCFTKLLAVMALEVFCRILGTWDYKVKGKNPFAWEIAKSTKNLGTGVKQ